MPEPWTGDLLGRMHNAGVKRVDLANHLGWTKSYVTQLLAGTRTTAGAREKLEAAFYEVLKNKEA